MVQSGHRGQLELASSLLQGGRPAEALSILGEALKRAPADFDALNLAGVAATRLKRSTEALAYLQRATEVRPHHAGAHNNLGIALRAAGEHERATTAYRRAISLEPRYAAARTNLGAALLQLGRHEEAVDSLDIALIQRPNHVETLWLKALSLRHMRAFEHALEAIDDAIALGPEKPEYHAVRGSILNRLSRYPDAEVAFGRAQALGSKDPSILGMLVQGRLRVCDWADMDAHRDELLAQVRAGEPAITPFSSLMLFDDPQMQLGLARSWGSRKAEKPLPDTRPPASGKLRIGYFSADMRNHPMAHLVGEMFARHDRERFEITVFAFPLGQSDEYTDKIRASVDRYVDIRNMSDAEAVQLARDLNIDVAVDMMGHTAGTRPGIFGLRAAPVQVSYVGFPGTTGWSELDYVVADRTIIPETATGDFAEQVLWLPDCYTSRDTRIELPPPGEITRQSQGLPEDAVVFCCFNQAVKIMPEQFRDWMEILRQVEGSVLWLLDAGEIMAANLRREAEAQGIDPARIVFAGRLPLAQHLARIRLADLCLDTLPYNAHTTANDSLFVGVPILTCPGRIFAARVCASLVTAVGMPELIVPDRETYVARAVELGRDPTQLGALRARLDELKAVAPLFNVERYTKSLEAGYAAAHDRFRNGLAPAHILVEAP